MFGCSCEVVLIPEASCYCVPSRDAGERIGVNEVIRGLCAQACEARPSYLSRGRSDLHLYRPTSANRRALSSADYPVPRDSIDSNKEETSTLFGT